MKNTFFLEDSYSSDIALDVNEDVLKRILSSGKITPEDRLPIEFAFVTDTKAKAVLFADALRAMFNNYSRIEVNPYNDQFEIVGKTDEIQMMLQPINQWNQIMWDLGYDYDCKLDGWLVEESNH